jgi:hypothetical protein
MTPEGDRALRRALAGGVVVVLVAAAWAAVVTGSEEPSGLAPLVAGATWIARPSRGDVVQADAVTGRVVTRVPVAEPGAPLDVVRSRSAALVLDRRAGRLRLLTGRSWHSRTLDEAVPPGAFVVAGATMAWLLSGAVAQPWDLAVDPPTRPRGPAPVEAGTTAGRAVVSDDGTLWALDGAGRLRCQPAGDHGRCPGHTSTRPESRRVVLVAGRPVMVDPGLALAVGPDGGLERWDLGLPADARFAGSAPTDIVAVSDTTGAAYLRSGAASPARRIDLGDPVPGRTYGEPVVLDRRIFVPRHGAGDVLVVDTGAPGSPPARVALPPGIGDVELFAQDGRVWFQERTAAGTGDAAGVITPDLRAIAVHGGDDGSGEPPDPTGDRGFSPWIAPPDAAGPTVPARRSRPEICAVNRPAVQCPPLGPPRPVAPDRTPSLAGCPRQWPAAGCGVGDPGGGRSDRPPPVHDPPAGDHDDGGPAAGGPGEPGVSFTRDPAVPRAGSPVVFTDTSTVAHDRSSWSFPGAAPDRSPIAAPTVSWSEPGTYRVTLAVDGAGGHHEYHEDIQVAGPDEVVVPRLAGLTLDEARSALASAGLRPGTVARQRSGSSPDTVVAATSDGRSLGELQLLSAGSVVDLVASDGRGAAQVASGGGISCARLGDGTVLCWGLYVGPPSADSGLPTSATPVVVPGLHGASTLAIGGYHGCAVRAGAVLCWGNNASGQVGSLTADSTTDPVPVPGVTDAVALALGYQHSCALLAGGDVLCWGDNSHGQLGDGSTAGSPVPRAVPGWHGVGALAAGEGFTCAVLADHTVSCVGAPDRGDPVDPTWEPAVRSRPYTVGWATDVVALTAGAVHLCVVHGDGTTGCTEPLHGATPPDWPQPPVSTMDVGGPGVTVRQIDAGYTYTCAGLSSGEVVCRGGLDDIEQLGEGTRPIWLPLGGSDTRVAGLDDVVALDAGGFTVCALRRDASVSCWGNNGNGQLGNGTFGDSPVAVTAELPP